MNRDKAIRTAFYNALNNNISVPVFDGRAESGLNKYVTIDTQNAENNSDFEKLTWDSAIYFSICHKQDDSYTKDIIDDISEEIENIILPGKAHENGLPSIAGWHMTVVRLSNVDYSEFKISETQTLAIKYLTFRLIIQKTN